MQSKVSWLNAFCFQCENTLNEVSDPGGMKHFHIKMYFCTALCEVDEMFVLATFCQFAENPSVQWSWLSNAQSKTCEIKFDLPCLDPVTTKTLNPTVTEVTSNARPNSFCTSDCMSEWVCVRERERYGDGHTLHSHWHSQCCWTFCPQVHAGQVVCIPDGDLIGFMNSIQGAGQLGHYCLHPDLLHGTAWVSRFDPSWLFGGKQLFSIISLSACWTEWEWNIFGRGAFIFCGKTCNVVPRRTNNPPPACLICLEMICSFPWPIFFKGNKVGMTTLKVSNWKTGSLPLPLIYPCKLLKPDQISIGTMDVHNGNISGNGTTHSLLEGA